MAKTTRAKQLKIGKRIELEHGKIHPKTNITNDDPKMTRKIAEAHINEIPDYYDRLVLMEKKAKSSKKMDKVAKEKTKPRTVKKGK
jgi:hypothetical protein